MEGKRTRIERGIEKGNSSSEERGRSRQESIELKGRRPRRERKGIAELRREAEESRGKGMLRRHWRARDQEGAEEAY